MPPLSDLQREALLAELSGLHRFCYSLTGSQADADDLLQATMEKILEKGMPVDAHVARWAFRVCKNAWIDEVRARDVRQRYPEQAEEPDGAASAEHVAMQERQVTAVSEALQQLPPDQRLALTLVAVDGKSYAEAAEILEVPVGTIMSRIARARRQLADVFETSSDS